MHGKRAEIISNKEKEYNSKRGYMPRGRWSKKTTLSKERAKELLELKKVLKDIEDLF